MSGPIPFNIGPDCHPSGNPFRDLIPRGPVQEANPHRVGACRECGAYRTDGRAPYIHKDDCPHEGDPQMDRWLAEQQAGDHGGPVLYCAEHDHVIPGMGR